MLEWVAIPSFRRFSQPRDRTQFSCITGRFFTIWAIRKAYFRKWAAVSKASLKTIDWPVWVSYHKNKYLHLCLHVFSNLYRGRTQVPLHVQSGTGQNMGPLWIPFCFQIFPVHWVLPTIPAWRAWHVQGCKGLTPFLPVSLRLKDEDIHDSRLQKRGYRLGEGKARPIPTPHPCLVGCPR